MIAIGGAYISVGLVGTQSRYLYSHSYEKNVNILVHYGVIITKGSYGVSEERFDKKTMCRNLTYQK
jgi:hypothetical protein